MSLVTMLVALLRPHNAAVRGGGVPQADPSGGGKDNRHQVGESEGTLR